MRMTTCSTSVNFEHVEPGTGTDGISTELPPPQPSKITDPTLSGAYAKLQKVAASGIRARHAYEQCNWISMHPPQLGTFGFLRHTLSAISHIRVILMSGLRGQTAGTAAVSKCREVTRFQIVSSWSAIQIMTGYMHIGLGPKNRLGPGKIYCGC